MVRLVGYDLYNRPGIVLDAVSKAVDLGTIAMKPLEVGLAEVEVVAQKKQVIYKLDKKVIEASSNLLAGGGSAVDILENTPPYVWMPKVKSVFVEVPVSRSM